MPTHDTRLDTVRRIGRALADPTRATILLELLDSPQYPADLAEKLQQSRSNVSNHLSCLKDCGIIQGHTEGRKVLYSIANQELKDALNALLEVTLEHTTDVICIDDCNTVEEYASRRGNQP
ncbi:ArsR/SmtB family transcription factor [Corynebacterium aquilae]|uniref:HTH arsR-type domain-containing protein n=1 Tax=Corynebacterium aquilae DSM 44791 TaxID=1431546 RepID=A0A1L7CIP5_9CORY|nr:metalloregulator ArsR/SmtB family transcription factor [Corynebacterium aquilae]APT85737.1 hypothetical protein CAQU_12610 [Corynebacterium aquilae DSM 44791]